MSTNTFVSFFDSPFYRQDEDTLILEGEDEETEEERRIRELQELLELEEAKERIALLEQQEKEEELIKLVEPVKEDSADFVSFFDSEYANITEEEFKNKQLQEQKNNEDISKWQKFKLGFEFEPTVLGNMIRLGKDALAEPYFQEALIRAERVSDKDLVSQYSPIPLEKHQEIAEANRRERIYKRQDPEMKGMIEELETEIDFAFMGGRMLKAIADPATLFMPWTKTGSFIKLKNTAKAGAFASTDMALYEKAIYGEISPLNIGIAAFLGGSSTLLGQTIVNRFRKIDEPIRNVEGKVIDRIVIEGEKDIAPNITTKQFRELSDNLITKESKTIDKTIESFNELGISSGQLNTLKTQRAELIVKQRSLLKDKNKTVVPSYSKPIFTPLEEALIYGGRAPVIKGQPIETLPNRLNRQIKELDQKIKTKKDQRDTDLFNYMEGFTALKVKELEQFQKLGGNIDNTVGIWFADMAVRPLIGAAGGFALGELILDEELKENGGLEAMMFIGASLGVLQKKVQNSKLTLKNKEIINKELKTKELESSKRTIFSLAKKWSGGSLAPRVSAWGEETGMTQLSKRNLRQQGAELGLGERALETTDDNIQRFKLDFNKKALEVVYKADEDLFNMVDPAILPVVFKLRNKFIEPDEVLREVSRIVSDSKKNFGSLTKAEKIVAQNLEKDVFKTKEGYDNFYKQVELYSLENGINMKSLGLDYGFPQQFNKQFIRENTKEAVSIVEQSLKRQNEIQVQRGDYGYWSPSDKKFIPVEEIENVKKLKYKPIKKLRDGQIKRQAQGIVDKLKQEQIEINSLFTIDSKPFREFQTFDGVKENVLVKAAYNLEKTRIVSEPEARKILQPLLINDPMVLTNNLINNIVPVVEFAKVNGPKGEAIVKVLEKIDSYFPKDKFGNKTNVQIAAETDVKDMVDALFDRYVGNAVIKKGSDLQKQFFAVTQAITVGGSLDKASIPSLAEFIQPFQNSRYFKATMDGFWNSFIKMKENGERLPRMSDDLGYHVEQQMKMFKIDIPFLLGKKATRVNPQAIKMDNSGYDFLNELGTDIFNNKNLDTNAKVNIAVQKYLRQFMEASGISKITRSVRTFAYDAAANDVFYMGMALNKGKKPNQAMLTAINNLGLDLESVKYIATKGKNARDAFFGDVKARRLLDIAGRKGMNRDGIIPMAGNRMKFAQSKNPLVRWLGTFTTWAMAKTTQNNALYKRMERGDLKLAVKMLGALTLWYPLIHYFQTSLSTSDRVKDEFFNGEFYEMLASSLRFSGQIVPWYGDKAGNIMEYNADSFWNGISPQSGWWAMFIEQLSEGLTDPKEIPESLLTITEKSIPLAEDISYHTGLEAAIKDDEEYIPDANKRGKFFDGGTIDLKQNPVPNVAPEPSERINPYTGEPYEAEMERLGFKDGLLVSIGVAPVSEKQISKLKKSLKKRQAKRNGGKATRNYAKEYANYHSSEKQKKDRAHRNNANRQLKREGRIAAGDGKDVDHKDGNPRNNSPSNLRTRSKNANRTRKFSGGKLLKALAARKEKPIIEEIEVLGRRRGKFILEEDIISSDDFGTHNEKVFRESLDKALEKGLKKAEARKKAIEEAKDKGSPARLKKTTMKDLLAAQKEYGKPIYLGDSTVGAEYKIQRQNEYFKNLKDYKKQGYYNDPKGNKISSKPDYQAGAKSFHTKGQAIDLNRPYYQDYNREELKKLVPILGKHGFVQDPNEEWHFSQGEQGFKNIYR